MSTGLDRPCKSCGELIASGTYCADCKPTKPSATQRGYPAWWAKLSTDARRWQPFCTDCGTQDNLSLDHTPQAWRLIEQGKRLTLKHVASGLLAVVCADCNRRRGAARGSRITHHLGRLG